MLPRANIDNSSTYPESRPCAGFLRLGHLSAQSNRTAFLSHSLKKGGNLPITRASNTADLWLFQVPPLRPDNEIARQ
jgi:hypothetical protein